VADRTALLLQAAERFGTPAYVYDVEAIAARARTLTAAFGDRLALSYAVKANPNAGLLARMLAHVATLDVSSYGEVWRALAIGCPPGRLTFSGPAKRPAEVRGAVADGVGELVLESWTEAETADRAGEIFRSLRSQGITLSLPGTLIGATALLASIPLYTCNPRHYPMTDLDLHAVPI